MKIQIMPEEPEKQIHIVEAMILGIKQRTRKGFELIYLETDAGTFSNYKHVFESQNIDVAYLKCGDMLRISYVVANEIFKNFLTVEVVEAPEQANVGMLVDSIAQDNQPK